MVVVVVAVVVIEVVRVVVFGGQPTPVQSKEENDKFQFISIMDSW